MMSAEERHETGLATMLDGARTGSEKLWDQGARQLQDAPPNIIAEALSIRRPQGNSQALTDLILKGSGWVVKMRRQARHIKQQKTGDADTAETLENHSEWLHNKLVAAAQTHVAPLFIDAPSDDENMHDGNDTHTLSPA